MLLAASSTSQQPQLRCTNSTAARNVFIVCSCLIFESKLAPGNCITCDESQQKGWRRNAPHQTVMCTTLAKRHDHIFTAKLFMATVSCIMVHSPKCSWLSTSLFACLRLLPKQASPWGRTFNSTALQKTRKTLFRMSLCLPRCSGKAMYWMDTWMPGTLKISKCVACAKTLCLKLPWPQSDM